ncbi:MAG: B-box zinc finger protein [Bacteroidetes bacterium]|nr:B-box zinc finger protein [Bacteroidota bacterium]MCL5025448.1 B-box zinc finger protein [Chloroflexota bacterium]
MAETLTCARHPHRPTVLRCGKCGQPICIECTIQTPVGARCRECAQLRPLPQYDVHPGQYAKAAVNGLFMSAGMAVICFEFLRAIPFSMWLAPLLAGYAVGASIHRTADRKRGPGLRRLAIGFMLFSTVFGELFYLGMQGLLASPGLIALGVSADLLRILLYAGVGSYMAIRNL